MIKNEILKNSGLNEEMANEDREEVKKAVLTFLSMFPGTGFSFEEVRSKIGREFSSEDFEEVIADMILDGLLRGTSYSFFLTDKGRSQVKSTKTNIKKEIFSEKELEEIGAIVDYNLDNESGDWNYKELRREIKKAFPKLSEDRVKEYGGWKKLIKDSAEYA